MGKTLMGSQEVTGNAQLLTPEQMQFLQQAGNIYGNLAGEEGFQKHYVEPALRQYEQQTLPAVQQRFTDLNAGSSSALNQALSQSAVDLQSALAGQFGQVQMGAAQGLGGLAGIRTYEPMIQQNQGILGPLIKAGGAIGGGYMRSSRTVKENIQDYECGLEEVLRMDVKKYDYKGDMTAKNCVGLIAEELPDELTHEIDGVLHVDLYGLVAMTINSIKQIHQQMTVLKRRIEVLEAH